MALPFLFVSAIVPSLLLIWFFHARDLYPEPQRVVWATFGLGVLTILPAVGVELLVDSAIKQIGDPFAEGWLQAFLSAALTEESLKYAVVVLYCMRHKEFDEPMDGIVYGAIASLGFATLENCIYVGEGGGGTAILRALTAVPGHACMGAIMGYFVGQAKFTPARRGRLLAKAFLIPFLLHGLYDGPLLAFARLSAHKRRGVDPLAEAGPFLVITFLALGFEVVWTLVLSSRLRKQQKEFMASQWAAYYARQPPPAPPWALAASAAARVFAPIAQAPYQGPHGPVRTEFGQPAIGTDLVRPGLGTELSQPVMGTQLSHPVAGTQLSQPAVGTYGLQPAAGTQLAQPVMQTRLGRQADALKTEVTPAPPFAGSTLVAPQAYAAEGPSPHLQAQKTVPLPVQPPQAQAPAPYAQPGFPSYVHHDPPDVVAWSMIAFGGLMASGAGLVVLGVAVLLLSPSTAYGRVAPYVLVGLFMGALPLAAGLTLFAFGARRLARSSARPPPMAWA